VVAANIDARLVVVSEVVQVRRSCIQLVQILEPFETAEPTRKEVQTSRTRIDSRIRGPVLAQAVVGSHDPPDHVVYPLDWNTSIVHCSGQIAAEV